MRTSFSDNLKFNANIRGCVRTQRARMDRSRDIHHLEGGILDCWHVRAQRIQLILGLFPHLPSQGWGWEFTKPLNLLLGFPQKQLLCKQI